MVVMTVWTKHVNKKSKQVVKIQRIHNKRLTIKSIQHKSPVTPAYLFICRSKVKLKLKHLYPQGVVQYNRLFLQEQFLCNLPLHLTNISQHLLIISDNVVHWKDSLPLSIFSKH